MLTLSEVSNALPAGMKNVLSQAFVDKINMAVSDPIIAEQVRDNFITYSKVLQDGKYKMEDYLSAVMYVSHKLMGCTNKEAYMRTFPDRYDQLILDGRTPKEISAYVAMYSKGKLVNAIMEQSLVPSWVLNQEAYQKAINTQVELMTGAQSELVRTQAANSILTHLAKPKEAGPLLNIDLRETSGMTELRDMLGKLATQQSNLIANGVTARDIAAQRIIDVGTDNGTD